MEFKDKVLRQKIYKALRKKLINLTVNIIFFSIQDTISKVKNKIKCTPSLQQI